MAETHNVDNYFRRPPSSTPKKNTLQLGAGLTHGSDEKDLVDTFSISAAAGVANHATITFAALTGKGVANVGVWPILVYLSDSATGDGLTATNASGTVQALSGEGTDLSALTAKKAILALTKGSTGTYKLDITDTAKTLFVPCCVNFMTGRTIAGAALVTGNYG